MAYTYILIIYAVVISLILLNKYSKIKVSFMMISTIITSLFAFGTLIYEPAVSDDLYRLNIALEQIRNFSKSSYIHDSLWLQILYFKVIAYIPDNRALVFITVIIDLIVAFLLYNMHSKEEGISLGICMSGLLLFINLWDYGWSASNVHYILPGTIFIYVLYLDLVKKKNLVFCMTIYICMVFFHQAMVVLLIIRLALLFIKNKEIYFGICVAVLLQKFWYTVVGKILGGMPGAMFSLLKYKYESVLRRMDLVYAKRLFLKIPVEISLVILLLIFMLNYDKEHKFEKYCKYLLLLACISLGGYYDLHLCVRHMLLFQIMFIPIYLNLLNILYRRKEKGFHNFLHRMPIWIANIFAAANLYYMLTVTVPGFWRS